MYAKMWPEARDLVLEHAPDAEFVWTGASDYHYWQETLARWGQDDLVTIEQDVGIHSGVIPEFSECPEPWCTFGYQIGSAICYTGNGCRKISLEAQQAVTIQHLEYPPPEPAWKWAVPHPTRSRGIMDIGDCPECAALCWRHLDTRIATALERAGFPYHVHTPNVRHLRMPKIDGG
jgi:hypothetical protein